MTTASAPTVFHAGKSRFFPAKWADATFSSCASCGTRSKSWVSSRSASSIFGIPRDSAGLPETTTKSPTASGSRFPPGELMSM